MLPRHLLAFGSGLLLLAAGGVTWALVGLRQQAGRLEERARSAEARLEHVGEQLEQLAKEVTRFRIEQRAEGKGPAALLEKLRTYAPLLVSARTTQPDMAMADAEMKAVLDAFEALGSDASAPVRRRFDDLEPKQSFDEMRWLMEALLRCDRAAGIELVLDVLTGTKKPSARLRWAAGHLLLQFDRPAAQRTLRRILRTETSRGVDPDRAAAYGTGMLDPAAVAVSGFHNFVGLYLRSEDPETEETLLQVVMRSDQDAVTLKEVIEVLGQLRCVRAQKRIEQLYRHPPGAQQDPLFLNKCLDALAAILGDKAQPFLETELARAEHELVQKHIQHLLQPAVQAPRAPQPR